MWMSIAVWPQHPKLHLGNTNNVTTDTHDTETAARHICDMLETHGFGLDGEIFPISTSVKKL